MCFHIYFSQYLWLYIWMPSIYKYGHLMKQNVLYSYFLKDLGLLFLFNPPTIDKISFPRGLSPTANKFAYRMHAMMSLLWLHNSLSGKKVTRADFYVCFLFLSLLWMSIISFFHVKNASMCDNFWSRISTVCGFERDSSITFFLGIPFSKEYIGNCLYKFRLLSLQSTN